MNNLSTILLPICSAGSLAIIVLVIRFITRRRDRNSKQHKQFKTVITSLRNIAPLDAVNPLIGYLEELNDSTEKGNTVSTDIVLSIINTLGAIGNKAAFDSLLAVTYLNYEESVLTAAREALSGLRWQ